MSAVTREYIDEKFDEFAAMMAKNFALCAMKEDLKALELRVDACATKKDLEQFAKKVDLEQFATKQDLTEMTLRIEARVDAHFDINRKDISRIDLRAKTLENAVFGLKPA
jgi:hypothetical protein